MSFAGVAAKNLGRCISCQMLMANQIKSDCSMMMYDVYYVCLELPHTWFSEALEVAEILGQQATCVVANSGFARVWWRNMTFYWHDVGMAWLFPQLFFVYSLYQITVSLSDLGLKLYFVWGNSPFLHCCSPSILSSSGSEMLGGLKF